MVKKEQILEAIDNNITNDEAIELFKKKKPIISGIFLFSFIEFFTKECYRVTFSTLRYLQYQHRMHHKQLQRPYQN